MNRGNATHRVRFGVSKQQSNRFVHLVRRADGGGRSQMDDDIRAIVLVFSQPGALPASALEQVIAGVRALDMDDIRKNIAQTQDAATAS